MDNGNENCFASGNINEKFIEFNRDCPRNIFELVRNCLETIWVKTSIS